MPPKKQSRPKKAHRDDRVTLKIDRALWNRINDIIKSHPEWGIISVPDFIRRAVDCEIRTRHELESSRVISLCFAPDSEDKRRKVR